MASPRSLQALLKVAVRAVQEAGGIVLHRPRPGTVACKTVPRDLVSEIDRRSQQALRRTLTRAFPGIGFRGEEGDEHPPASGLCWHVDPLDGTVNHVHGVPHFAVSVACAEGDRVLVGATLDPVRRELFTATRGGGAFANGGRLRVSCTDKLDRALLASGFPYDRAGPNNNFDFFTRMLQAARGVRRLGSACLDLAYVAAGRFDGYWELTLHAWDFAAGTLFVEEAGGRATAVDGSPLTMASRAVLASNDRLHGVLVEELHPQGRAAARFRSGRCGRSR